MQGLCVVFWVIMREDNVQVCGQNHLPLFLPSGARPQVRCFLSHRKQATQPRELYCFVSLTISDTTIQLTNTSVSQTEFLHGFTDAACLAVLCIQTSLFALFIPSTCLNLAQCHFLQEAFPDILA